MPTAAYQRHRQRAAERQRQLSAAGREIGPLPAVVDPQRRRAAVRSFRTFAETYFRKRVNLSWSDAHLVAIETIERLVQAGGTFALAMPRRSGKSTLCELGVLWAILTGRRRFVVLICATDTDAVDRMTNLRTELATNDLLAEDFPEVCTPIRELSGEARKCKGQRYCGRPTHITWDTDEVRLPQIPHSVASGATIISRGIMGHLRGMVRVLASGESIRPDLVIGDDVQTDQSAASIIQTETRLRILKRAIRGLAGPGKTLTAFLPCTVIEQRDLADQLCDHVANPDVESLRTKTLDAMPDRMDLWAEYMRIRREVSAAAATDFYRLRLSEMHAGARVVWPDNVLPGDLDALQSAMNWALADPDNFASEGQNDPLARHTGNCEQPDPQQIARQLSGLKRGVIPGDMEYLTAMVDVQQRALYWMVCAWREDFTGTVVDYSAWPDPGRSYYTLRELDDTIQRRYPKAALEGQLTQALTDCTAELFARKYKREDGTPMHISRMLVDSGWKSELVYKFCRSSPHRGLILPSNGIYIGAAKQPMEDWKIQPGERRGLNWCVRSARGGIKVRLVHFDTNFFKSFVHARLTATIGDAGSLSLFGDDPAAHRMLVDHLCAEYRVRTEGRGRVVDEWQCKVNEDNHFLDDLVGNAVAAATLGCKLAELAPPKARSRRRRPHITYL